MTRLFEDGDDNGNNLLATFVLVFHLQKTLEKIMNGVELDEDDVLEDNIELLSQEFNLSGKTDVDLYRNRLTDFNKNIRRLHKSIVEKYALKMGVGGVRKSVRYAKNYKKAMETCNVYINFVKKYQRYSIIIRKYQLRRQIASKR